MHLACDDTSSLYEVPCAALRCEGVAPLSLAFDDVALRETFPLREEAAALDIIYLLVHSAIFEDVTVIPRMRWVFLSSGSSAAACFLRTSMSTAGSAHQSIV